MRVPASSESGAVRVDDPKPPEATTIPSRPRVPTSPSAWLGRRPFGLEWTEALVLAAIAGWSALSLVVPLRHAAHGHLTFTGADGPLPGDQLQYFAWIRQAGDHVLIGNVWDLAPAHHVFLHPLFLISGLIWRLGVSVPVAYLVWKPVAVVVLFAGVLAYARRLLPTGSGWRAAAVVLSLFYYAPISWLLSTGLGFTGVHGDAAGELFAAGQLWGYLPNALALGLMPLFLIGAERILDAGRRPPGRGPGRYIALTAVAGALTSWLHPWQGETLVLICVGWIAWDRSWQRLRPLTLPVLATLTPIAYYFALSRWDSAWQIAAKVNTVTRPALWILALGLLPLALPAVFGLRPRARDLQERALVLWPVAALTVYFVTPSVAPHALQGLCIPLSVLAVRGWSRLLRIVRAGSGAWRRRAPAWVGIGAIALLVVPGDIHVIDLFRKLVGADNQAFLITSDENHALSYTASSAQPGGVLAPLFIALDVPPTSGRQVWVGHQTWTPSWATRQRQVESLFDTPLPAPQAQAFVRSTGASVLVSDCRRRVDLAPELGSLLARVHRFGCASVYELSGPPRPPAGVATRATPEPATPQTRAEAG